MSKKNQKENFNKFSIFCNWFYLYFKIFIHALFLFNNYYNTKKTKSILREKINKKLRKNTTEIYHGKEQFN